MATWMEDGVASAVRVVSLPASVSGVIGPQNANQNLTYMGFSVEESAGASAVIKIRANGVVTGAILDVISLVANESTSDWYGPQGLNAGSGVYVELVSGAMPVGTVRIY